jgi:general stress protein YciG
MRPKAVQEYFEKIARKGGKARAAKLNKTERSEIARKAAKTRWSKKPTQK